MTFGKIGARKMMYEWKNPYVTKGLIAMWDAEWNAGPGVHDPNATTWKDLIGSNDLDLYGGAVFASDHLVIDTASRLYSATPITTVGTLEICLSRTDAYNDVCLFTLNSAGGRSMRNFVSWYSNKIGFSESDARTNLAMAQTKDWAATTFTFVPSSGAVYSGGAAQQNLSEAFYYPLSSNLGGVAINPSVSSQSISGNWYSIRVYSRALTAAEIAANYAIDKARFNLP